MQRRGGGGGGHKASRAQRALSTVYQQGSSGGGTVNVGTGKRPANREAAGNSHAAPPPHKRAHTQTPPTHRGKPASQPQDPTYKRLNPSMFQGPLGSLLRVSRPFTHFFLPTGRSSRNDSVSRGFLVDCLRSGASSSWVRQTLHLPEKDVEHMDGERAVQLVFGARSAAALVTGKVEDKNLVLQGRTASAENTEKKRKVELAAQRRKQRAEQKAARRRRNHKIMSNSERKRRKLFHLEKEALQFHLFEPLHELWLQYFAAIAPASKPLSQCYPHILKADFHGCIMSVIRCRCPTYVGVSGIVLQETEKVFRIITRDNELKGLKVVLR